MIWTLVPITAVRKGLLIDLLQAYDKVKTSNVSPPNTGLRYISTNMTKLV